MKTTVLKIVAAVGILTVAGGGTFAAIYDKSADEQNTHTIETKMEQEGVIQAANVEKGIRSLVGKDTVAPVLSADTVTLTVGDKVDIFNGIKAIDDRDGDLTARVVADKALDAATVGEQVIRFSATDNSANVGTIDRTFKVVEPKEAAEVIEPAPAEQEAVEAAYQEAVEVQQAAPAAEAVADATPAPVAEAASTAPAPAATPAPAAPTYQAMTMYINGQAIPYQNGGQGSGQSIIDANPYGVVSTWGGASVQSGSDGMNTHFIGHNPGIFGAVFGLGGGSQVIVTDSAGTPTTYVVSSTTQVDDYGREIGTGNDLWDLTVGTGGGERITLQTCINDDVNLFVFAYKQ